MAKKNRALQTQVESYKNKAAKAAEVAISMSEKKQSPAKEIKPMIPQSPVPQTDDRKLKDLEKRITKLRNENQTLNDQCNKATKLLEREIGEVVDVDSLYKEDSNWRGRAQKIEVLKQTVRRLKNNDDTLSVISETPSVYKMSPAEKNLSTMQTNKAREIDVIKASLASKDDEVAGFKKRLQAACARRDTLEVQLKDQKQMF